MLALKRVFRRPASLGTTMSTAVCARVGTATCVRCCGCKVDPVRLDGYESELNHTGLVPNPREARGSKGG